MLPKGIVSLPIEKWTNKHQNFTHPLVKNASFKLYNPPGENHRERYLGTTRNFQWLIKHAEENNLKLRAMGSGWSFSKVGVTQGGIVDTAALNFSFPLKERYVNSQYTGAIDDLYFLQCGTIIHETTRRLAAKMPPRSIKASGASNGQTIAGAFSTGTHGAAIREGAVQDTVVGLHIITGADRHVWLERASYPVASREFVEWLGAEFIRDDAIFNSALVSFGSFGFIHGVMIETEPIFLLEEHKIANIPYGNSLKKAMRDLDFSDLPIEDFTTSRELYHFEVLFNLHDFKPDNASKGAYIKCIYKKPYILPYQRPKRSNDFTYGDDLLGIISTLLDRLGSGSRLLIPVMVNTLFKMAFSPEPPKTATLGDLFDYTKFRGEIASAAIGIDSKDSPEVVEVIIEVNRKHPFPGGLALRYVKGTKAKLGFTKFPITCVLEMDGVDGESAKVFFTAVWAKLEELNIAYTLHWGKINFILNKERVLTMYGKEAMDTWISSRNMLLSAPALEIFDSEFIAKCGLNKIQNL
jgi:hypothetical protein